MRPNWARKSGASTRYDPFLDAYDWPVGESFARKALGHALHRQAVRLAQHVGMDVLAPIAARFPLRDISTLDDLAIRLFGA